MWNKKIVGSDATGKEVEQFLTKSYIQELFGRLATQEDADNTRMFVFKVICEKMNKGEETIKINAEKCLTEFTKQYPDLVLRTAKENPEYAELLKKHAILAEGYGNATKKVVEFTSSANKNLDDVRKAIGQEDLNMLCEKVAEGKWRKTDLSKGKEVEEFLIYDHKKKDNFMKKLFGKAISNNDLEKGQMVIFEIICEETLKVKKNNKAIPKVDCIEKFKENYKDLFNKLMSNSNKTEEPNVSDQYHNVDSSQTDLVGELTDIHI